MSERLSVQYNMLCELISHYKIQLKKKEEEKTKEEIRMLFIVHCSLLTVYRSLLTVRSFSLFIVRCLTESSSKEFQT